MRLCGGGSHKCLSYFKALLWNYACDHMNVPEILASSFMSHIDLDSYFDFVLLPSQRIQLSHVLNGYGVSVSLSSVRKMFDIYTNHHKLLENFSLFLDGESRCPFIPQLTSS